MKKCDSMLMQLLNGSPSPELQKHLQECSECQKIFQMMQVTASIQFNTEKVPQHLNQKILRYAADKIKKKNSVIYFNMKNFIQKALIPIAASFALCFALIWNINSTKTEPQDLAALSHQTIHYLEEIAVPNLNSELLMLSETLDESSMLLASTEMLNYNY